MGDDALVDGIAGGRLEAVREFCHDHSLRVGGIPMAKGEVFCAQRLAV